jgi:hypothetical protein
VSGGSGTLHRPAKRDDRDGASAVDRHAVPSAGTVDQGLSLLFAAFVGDVCSMNALAAV